MLPKAGCGRSVPGWPLGKASSVESALWKDLWRRPIAEWWHLTATAPLVVARYVRLVLADPAHAQVGLLEKELGLTPASLVRLKLTVDEPEPVAVKATRDPYKHLRSVS